jgi:negative regulator of sigma E activity
MSGIIYSPSSTSIVLAVRMSVRMGGMTNRKFSFSRGGSALVIGVALSVTALTGCGSDDDGVSSEEAFCAAGDSLRSNVGDLVNLDIIAGGTDALNETVDAIEADLVVLQESGSDVASDEIAALQSSFEELDSTVDAMVDGISVENATGIVAAVTNVGSTAAAVYEVLSTTCP